METLSSGLKSASSPFLVYEQVDAEIEMINFDMSNSDTVDLELEPVVFEKEEPTDPNENKYSKTTKNKLAVLKCEKTAYFEASKDRHEDLIREGQKVQQEYQDYNKKVSEGCFSQYNPYSLRDFVKSFIKFRKGKKCTQDDVRRGLENFMEKPLATLMISKFEKLNLSGTKMVGIQMLLKFWMKIKSLEENQKTALHANQRSMLNDLRRGKVLNVLDDSIIDEQNVVAVEASNYDILTTENEQTIARFKFDAGILTRQFDCAEISEKVDFDSGVKEKLQNLKQKERMRKEELKNENVQMGKEKKSSLEKEIGENVAKKKRGRPFSSQKGLEFGGSGNMRKACKTRICPAKTPSGKKTPENTNKNKLEKNNSRRESEASNRIVAGLKPDCKESESFEEQMSINIACVHLKVESSSGSDLPEANVRVEVDCDLMDEISGPTSETVNDWQLKALSNEMPAALDQELLSASSSRSSGAGLSENPVQVAIEADGSNFNITFNNSPWFLTHMERLMATEEYKADVKKMKEEKFQLTHKEHTYPEDLSSIRDQESAIKSQNRQPSEEMSINQSPDAGGDVPMAAPVIDVLKSNTGGHILSSGKNLTWTGSSRIVTPMGTK